MNSKQNRNSVRQKTFNVFWVVLQEGGSSGECYATVCQTAKEASKLVADHKKATYEAISLKTEMEEAVTLPQAVSVAEAMTNAVETFLRLQSKY